MTFGAERPERCSSSITHTCHTGTLDEYAGNYNCGLKAAPKTLLSAQSLADMAFSDGVTKIPIAGQHAGPELSLYKLEFPQNVAHRHVKRRQHRCVNRPSLAFDEAASRRRHVRFRRPHLLLR